MAFFPHFIDFLIWSKIIQSIQFLIFKQVFCFEIEITKFFLMFLAHLGKRSSLFHFNRINFALFSNASLKKSFIVFSFGFRLLRVVARAFHVFFRFPELCLRNVISVDRPILGVYKECYLSISFIIN